MNKYEQYLSAQTVSVASTPRMERMGAMEAVDYYALYVGSLSTYSTNQFMQWVESEVRRGFRWFEYDPEITAWYSYRYPR